MFPSSASSPAAAFFRRRAADRYFRRRGGQVFCTSGLMRFLLLTTSGMIDAERFSILPTHRTNFKRGPDLSVS